MSSRVVVPGLVVLLALPLSACGASSAPDPVAPAAAATPAPRVVHGRLRHGEYVRLRRAYASPTCPSQLKGTALLARLQAECHAGMRLDAHLEQLPTTLRGCVVQRSPTCAEARFDEIGAGFESVVRAARSVRRATARRHLPGACRSALQATVGQIVALRGMGESARELSADVDAGDLNGYVSSAQRLAGAAHHLLTLAHRRPHARQHLRRCPHA